MARESRAYEDFREWCLRERATWGEPDGFTINETRLSLTLSRSSRYLSGAADSRLASRTGSDSEALLNSLRAPGGDAAGTPIAWDPTSLASDD